MQDSPSWWLKPKVHDQSVPHYYGDTVRRLLLVGSIILLLALVKYPEILPGFPALGVVILILAAVFLAGLTNPQSRLSVFLDLGVSGLAFLVVQYAAVTHFTTDSLVLTVFREASAIAFIFAFYFASKSFRGMMR